MCDSVNLLFAYQKSDAYVCVVCGYACACVWLSIICEWNEILRIADSTIRMFAWPARPATVDVSQAVDAGKDVAFVRRTTIVGAKIYILNKVIFLTHSPPPLASCSRAHCRLNWWWMRQRSGIYGRYNCVGCGIVCGAVKRMCGHNDIRLGYCIEESFNVNINGGIERQSLRRAGCIEREDVVYFWNQCEVRRVTECAFNLKYKYNNIKFLTSASHPWPHTSPLCIHLQPWLSFHSPQIIIILHTFSGNIYRCTLSRTHTRARARVH